MAAAAALSARAGSLREAFVTSAVALVPALTQSSAEAWFKDIAKRYEEPHRAYHTMQHITDMHGAMEGMAGIEKHDAFVLAIAFHDAVYDPQSKSNEEDSALLLLDWLDEAGVKPATFGPDLAWVVKAILRTKAHSMEDKDSPLSIAHSVFGELDEGLSGLPSQDVLDLAAFLDVDMLVLSRPWEAYADYARCIRAEYACFPDADYRAGRSKVLRSFLDKLLPMEEAEQAAKGAGIVQGCIFALPGSVAGGAEAQARANVHREISILEGSDEHAWAQVMGAVQPA